MIPSLRLRKLLSRLNRRSVPIARPEIIARMNELEWPVFEPVVAFQEYFGGYDYYPRITPDNAWYSFSLEFQDGYAGLWKGCKEEKKRSVWWFECAWHSTAQASFYIEADGTFFAEDMEWAPSVCTWFEREAIEDELLDIQPSWYVYGWWLPEPMNWELLDKQLPVVAEASDSRIMWRTNDDVRLCQHIIETGIHVRAWSKTPPDAQANLRDIPGFVEVSEREIKWPDIMRPRETWWDRLWRR